MWFFICLSLPKKDPKLVEIMSDPFEVLEATESQIGKATCGNRDRDRALLITAGGCSCFLFGMNHGADASKTDAFENLIQVLLQHAPSVSILIHDARGDITRESVACKNKCRTPITDLIGQFPHLKLDVRYVVVN